MGNLGRRILPVAAVASLAAVFSAASRAELTSEVRMHNGAPALFVNGQLTSQTLAAPYRETEPDFRQFREAGVRIFNMYMRFDWSGPEEYDFDGVDRRMEFYTSLDPKVLILARVLLSPGAWWGEQFPDDVSRRDDGSVANMFGQVAYPPSLSSKKYRERSKKAMTAFVTHMEEKWGDNMLGYQPGNGFGGEWLMFNSFWESPVPPTKFGVEDYSPVARAGFRERLRERYSTVNALRLAWDDPEVTFETADPPNEIERYSTTYGIFFDPAAGTRVPDFIQYFNHTVANVLLENCAWVKELTNRKKLVGVFYGYLWCNFPNLSAKNTGHLGIERVFSSPDVDFICSPYTYDNKQVGGPNNSQTLPEQAMLHGKLYFNEVDTETHLHKRQWRWGNSLHLPENWAETRGLLLRDFGYSFTKGMGLWWTDLRGGNYDDPQIIGLLTKLKQIDDQHLSSDKRLTGEIAVILDEDSFTYFGDGEPFLNALMTAQKQWHLGYLGAPWEPYLLADIANPNLRDFKLYIFLNTFRVTPQERAAIHAKLKRNNATALWVYAPGYITDDGLSTDAMRELTGISIVEDAPMGELHIDVTNREHQYAAALPEGHAYGTDVGVADIIRTYDHQLYLKDPRDPGAQRDLPGFRVGPRFYVDDDDATVLGRVAGIVVQPPYNPGERGRRGRSAPTRPPNPENNQPGLVVKAQDGWTSVYSSAPIVSHQVLRGIAKAAGCHIYSDVGDVVYANRDFLVVYAPNGGARTIHLPVRASRVIDLVEETTLAEDVDQFDLLLEPNTAVLLQMER
jgi:hypothetical protein